MANIMISVIALLLLISTAIFISSDNREICTTIAAVGSLICSAIAASAAASNKT